MSLELLINLWQSTAGNMTGIRTCGKGNPRKTVFNSVKMQKQMDLIQDSLAIISQGLQNRYIEGAYELSDNASSGRVPYEYCTK